MSKKLKSSEKIGFFHSVMSKNWTHDLLIFKGAFERVNQGCKRANRTHLALGLMSKKLKSSKKIGFFHSVMSKNWTHDLLIFKGAFDGGNQGCKIAREHIQLSVWCRKSWNLLRKLDFFILSWVRIELMTSELSRVLSKGAILRVKEQTNTFFSRSEVEKVDTFWDIAVFSPKWVGKFLSFPPRGQGGLWRGSSPM